MVYDKASLINKLTALHEELKTVSASCFWDTVDWVWIIVRENCYKPTSTNLYNLNTVKTPISIPQFKVSAQLRSSLNYPKSAIQLNFLCLRYDSVYPHPHKHLKWEFHAILKKWTVSGYQPHQPNLRLWVTSMACKTCLHVINVVHYLYTFFLFHSIVWTEVF